MNERWGKGKVRGQPAVKIEIGIPSRHAISAPSSPTTAPPVLNAQSSLHPPRLGAGGGTELSNARGE